MARSCPTEQTRVGGLRNPGEKSSRRKVARAGLWENTICSFNRFRLSTHYISNMGLSLGTKMTQVMGPSSGSFGSSGERFGILQDEKEFARERRVGQGRGQEFKVGMVA